MNEGFATRIAEAYGRHSQKYASILEPILRPMANEMVKLGSLEGVERVLDLATGTGLIARTEEVWADVEQGTKTLGLAGFTEIQVTTQLLSGEYRNSSDAIEVALAWPLTRYRIARLDRTDQEKLKEETAAAILDVDDLRWQSEIHIYQAIHSTAENHGAR